MYISRRETVIRGGLWVSLLSTHQKKSNDGSFVEFESLAREIKRLLHYNFGPSGGLDDLGSHVTFRLGQAGQAGHGAGPRFSKLRVE